MKAFADALEAVPIALAENSGLPPIESLTACKKRQLEENNPYLGIDCNETGNSDMRTQVRAVQYCMVWGIGCQWTEECLLVIFDT